MKPSNSDQSLHFFPHCTISPVLLCPSKITLVKHISFPHWNIPSRWNSKKEENWQVVITRLETKRGTRRKMCLHFLILGFLVQHALSPSMVFLMRSSGQCAQHGCVWMTNYKGPLWQSNEILQENFLSIYPISEAPTTFYTIKQCWDNKVTPERKGSLT